MTEKEQLFCHHYVVVNSARRAAEMAGYTPAWQQKSSLILDRPHVQEYIERLRKQIEAKAVKDGTDVVNEISKIAFMDATSFLKPDPDLPGHFVYKSPDELTPEQRSCVAEVILRNTEVRGKDGEPPTLVQSYSYRFHDKAQALLNLGKHFDVFGESKSMTVNVNKFAELPDEVLERLEKQMQDAIEGDFERLEDGARLPSNRGHH